MVVAVVESVNIEEKLSNTGYTIEWVLQMLHEHNPKFVAALGSNKVKQLFWITADDISYAKGYLSHVFQVVVEFDDSTNYSFIMKVPTMDRLEECFKKMDLEEEMLDVMKSELKVTHSKEVDAYNLIKDIKNFPRVEIYYREYAGEDHPGVIVMEDLSKTASTIGFFRTQTVQQCLNLARHLGIFQAQINMDIEKWRGKYTECFHSNSKTIKDFPKFAMKFTEQKPELTEQINRIIDVDFVRLAVYSMQELPEEYNATTICQGDCWSNNVMMCTAKDGSITDTIAAIIDWQIVFEGNPLFDLARFTTLCADGEIRRECERKAVDLLYDTYTEELKKIGKSAGYTREQAHELYDVAFLNQTYASIGMAAFLKLDNPERVAENVLEARYEKMCLRAKLCIEDALAIMDKLDLFNRFKMV